LAPEFSLSRQLAATHSAQPFLQHVDPDFLSPLLLHYGDDTPCIPVSLDGHLLPFLLDTGAAVSVLPKAKLVSLLTNQYRHMPPLKRKRVGVLRPSGATYFL